MPISDLTGTTWVMNDVLDLYNAYDDYAINFISNNESLNTFHPLRDLGQEPSVDYLYYGTNQYPDSIDAYQDGVWENEAYKTIEITGGTDVTNASLISWLEANATQQSSQLSVDLSTLSGWSNVSSGSHTLKVKAKATGYQDSALSEGASFTKAGSGYEIQLVGQNGAGEFVYVQINDDPTWYYAYLNNSGGGFSVVNANIPNAYDVLSGTIGIPNVSKIKIGTQDNPEYREGPQYYKEGSTGDFANLTFTITGGSAPAYATGEIIMTQNSHIYFWGDN